MSTSDAPDEQQRIDEIVDDGRCNAISTRYSRRCKNDSLPSVPYCPEHLHLLEK